MSYTKGEWLVMGNQRNGHYDFVLPMADDKDFQDNARLIAAAPNLLEALKGWASAVRLGMIKPVGLIDIETPLRLTEEAINKAEGNN